jgi:hypothetical protein
MHAAALNVAMGLVVQHSELSKDFATLKQFEADSESRTLSISQKGYHIVTV